MRTGGVVGRSGKKTGKEGKKRLGVFYKGLKTGPTERNKWQTKQETKCPVPKLGGELQG